MSKAFVNEDSLAAEVPDRPVSAHPNYVTRDGLWQIDASLAAAQQAFAEAQAADDREALMKAARDLRYWDSRRASAQLVETHPGSDIVQFGSRVSLQRDDGRHQTFRIVGEDEAEPARGTISHVSPLARAMLGRAVGDAIKAGANEAEITQIE